MAASGKIKTWAVEAVLENIRNGVTTMAQVEAANPAMVAAIRKYEARTRREEKMPSMFTGRVVRETEKAILFATANGQDWLPKSQITLTHDSDFDYVAMPQWLASQKSL